jgi:hypothetical protein
MIEPSGNKQRRTTSHVGRPITTIANQSVYIYTPNIYSEGVVHKGAIAVNAADSKAASLCPLLDIAFYLCVKDAQIKRDT